MGEGRGGKGRRLPSVLLVAGPLLLVLAAAFFLWGYLAHRDQVFPYDLARRVTAEVDLLAAPDETTMRLGRPTGAFDALANIPYVRGVADPRADLSGVLQHETRKASDGWNLFSPRYEPRAFLMAMDGRVVHRWRGEPSEGWQHVELLPGGGLLALVKDRELLRLDAASDVLWRYRDEVHHDLWVDGEDRIHVLTRRNELRPEIHPEIPTVVDRVTTLSPEGEVLDDLPLLDLLLDSPYAFLLPNVRGGSASALRELDVLHTNHVEGFDGRLSHRSPLYAEGNLLLSMRTLSTIFIVDPRQREVLWAWGPSNLVFQHHPTLLENGHLLVFNNGRERSEVVELDPLERKVVWRYRAEDFFSRARGSVQRLPNGNTLITESDPGYVFEVTPGGERVWVFANPFFTEGDKRMPIWRMTRFADGDPRLPPGLEPDGAGK